MARGADVSRPVEIVGGDRRCGYARCRASRGFFSWPRVLSAVGGWSFCFFLGGVLVRRCSCGMDGCEGVPWIPRPR